MKPRYVDFAGESRPVYFGFNAIYLLEQQGHKMSETMDVSADLAAQMLHVSLAEGARKEKKPYDLTIEDVRDGMDEYGIDRLDELIEVLMSFMVREEKPGEAPESL